ncbi:acyl-ACP--UDP-N-acetylglucosamine O-acyltransferase [Bdellovibrio svalbardensis]|uniref:Acyl-ACP--UDP-N-acetylglucosamine O-acyltransferase n=1 Tax=Bdellovibrio svalbardensis TaxID=2972972 RepID=A0ABT6DKZ6_9BACT|nr:acyl-ACP--UDP-N-acetylglucosamine O-acyltransferase [Bdellovibrio svalbardensis]MDG0817538.1 acyl-ACP--UDP-N-acetylglucosamine O-acyltransferase [Bdellovibrio svalbardensis]
MANYKIHPSSVISADVEIADDVEIGPYCLIQGKVKIGKGTFVEGHVTLGSRHGILEIGENNHFSPGAVIGGAPQDISYKGEPTSLIIGNNNTFREFSTVNLATSKHDKKTEIGNNGYFMAYTHIGHDCKVGNNVIIANDSHLGGHCIIDDGVTIGGVSAFNQFVRVGRGAFVAGSAVVNKDILPFCRAQGNYAMARATNKIGLSRKGFSREEVSNVHKAIRIMILGSHTVEEGIARVEQECVMSENIIYFINFMKTTKRGLAIDRSPKGWQDDE